MSEPEQDEALKVLGAGPMISSQGSRLHSRPYAPVVRTALKPTNRRVHPRVSFNTDLWIGEDGLFARSRARLNDVSIGGARIVTTECYRMGAILSLRFSLEGGFITSTVIVRNVRAGSIGVEFLDLSPEGRRLLETFIAASEPDFGR